MRIVKYSKPIPVNLSVHKLLIDSAYFIFMDESVVSTLEVRSKHKPELRAAWEYWKEKIYNEEKLLRGSDISGLDS